MWCGFFHFNPKLKENIILQFKLYSKALLLQRFLIDISYTINDRLNNNS